MYEMYFMNAEISGLLLYIVAVDKKEGFRLFIKYIYDNAQSKAFS